MFNHISQIKVKQTNKLEIIISILGNNSIHLQRFPENLLNHAKNHQRYIHYVGRGQVDQMNPLYHEGKKGHCSILSLKAHTFSKRFEQIKCRISKLFLASRSSRRKESYRNCVSGGQYIRLSDKKYQDLITILSRIQWTTIHLIKQSLQMVTSLNRKTPRKNSVRTTIRLNWTFWDIFRHFRTFWDNLEGFFDELGASRLFSQSFLTIFPKSAH